MDSDRKISEKSVKQLSFKLGVTKSNVHRPIGRCRWKAAFQQRCALSVKMIQAEENDFDAELWRGYANYIRIKKHNKST